MHKLELTKTIKERRKVLGINQKQLSEFTEIGLRTIKGLEAGKTNPIQEYMLQIHFLHLKMAF